MQLLYLGFVQEANSRRYRFQGVIPRDRITSKSTHLDFSLCADMALLAKYNIRFQDCPALCLEILAGGLSQEENAVQFSSYTVTSADLCTYSSAKSAVEAAKPPRRRPRIQYKPADSSQLKWPTLR